MDWFWWMIGGVVVLAIAALTTALYMWKLYKDFPETIKAKVVSVEKVEIDEYTNNVYRYHFKGRNKGNRMMTDCITYKEKKFKTGEKITVRMSKDGRTCHSNFPMWPIVTSTICILMAFVLIFVYVSDKRAQEANTFKQETGHFIVTDTDVLLNGDSMGLVVVEGGTEVVSTGDYGFIFYQGEPHYESAEADLMCVHSISTNVLTDGTVDTLDADLVEIISNMGYTINTVSTIYSEIVGTEEHYEGDGHNHAEDVIVDEAQNIVTTSPEETTEAEEDNVDAESTAGNAEVDTTKSLPDETIKVSTEPPADTTN